MSEVGGLRGLDTPAVQALVDAATPEGTSVLSTGEVGGTKFLREDGDGTCSWQTALINSDIGVTVQGYDSTILVDSDIGVNVQEYNANTFTRAITFVIDGGGATITTGVKGDLPIPFSCTITEVTMFADQTGSIIVDIWKDTYANFPPTDADSITALAVPTISSSTKSQDSTITGWTTSITAGDSLRYNVDSVTNIQLVTITLKVTI